MREEHSTVGVEYRVVAGFPAYRVGSDGTVWSCWKGTKHRRLSDTWRLLRPGRKEHGHRYVRISNDSEQKYVHVHRLVLEALVGPCPIGMEACHNDGNPDNNSIDNLRWDTRTGNVADTIRHGRHYVGSQQKHAKLNEDQVRQAFVLRSEGWTHEAIAKRFGVGRVTITRIFLGKRWKHVSACPG